MEKTVDIKKYERMGEELIRELGFEHNRVVLYWKAFEEKRWLACNFHYACNGLSKNK